ncbi:MAG: hypothetical protein LBN05_01390 [Oscillospiraceae bacterium]|jgi:hypothetical protein|nr:hypothetical protein [Oscillospiraceae bacterium]
MDKIILAVIEEVAKWFTGVATAEDLGISGFLKGLYDTIVAAAAGAL